MAHLTLQQLTQRFDKLTALDRLSLEVPPGEILSLLGPSGCGKTTTIRLIAGFLKPTAGKVLVNGKDIGSLPPEKRNMGIVFQSYALFPHLNVFENIAFGLKARGTSSAMTKTKVKRVLKLVNLSDYSQRPVTQLSGGEQQRVAVARAVAIEPKILLLDEPLSNLDASLREQTRSQLSQLIHQLGITAIFVTHDQEEAFALSDRVALLSEGVLQQIDTPKKLYSQPANDFVARFVGKSNLWNLTFRGYDQDCSIFLLPAGAELRLPSKLPQKMQAGRTYRLLLRPENIEFGQTKNGKYLLSARILTRRFTGASTEYFLEGEGQAVLVSKTNSPMESKYLVGDVIDLYCAPESFYFLPENNRASMPMTGATSSDLSASR